MIILVFGREGQVARELASRSTDGAQVVCLGRSDFDLLGGGDVERAITASGAGGVINAAAYTAVDRAESEPELAFRLNRDAPAAMARACARLSLPFVHFSTDYVFNGEKPDAYVEDDPRDPLGVYGASKAAGEDAVRDAGGRFAIIRTAWVFSGHGANFLKTMLRLAQTRDEVGVVDDQTGCPTWAADIAEAAMRSTEALNKGSLAPGVLHAAGDTALTWADFAELIFAEQTRRGLAAAAVRRITTADYPTPARRPVNSRLCNDKITRLIDWRPTPLPAAVASVIDQIAIAT